MNIKCIITEDVPLLAEMNRQLIEDEKAETDLTFSQLKNRMKVFIGSDYKAFLFTADEKIIGYSLCNMTKNPVYLRQFFICREERRKGYGKLSFYELLRTLGTKEIDIDVLAWNETGIKFWKSLGFEPRYFNMRYIISSQ